VFFLRCHASFELQSRLLHKNLRIAGNRSVGLHAYYLSCCSGSGAGNKMFD